MKRWPGPPVLSVALCLIGLALAGCSSPSSTTTTATGSGTLTVAGSTAMLPLVLEASGEYHPKGGRERFGRTTSARQELNGRRDQGDDRDIADGL